MQRIMYCSSSEEKYYRKKKGFQVFSFFSCPIDAKDQGFILYKDLLICDIAGQRAVESSVMTCIYPDLYIKFGSLYNV